LRGGRLSVGKGLLHCGFLIGELLGVFGVDHPPRHGIGNGLGSRTRRLLDRDGYRFDASNVRAVHIDAIDIVAGVVVFLVRDVVEEFDARSDAIHLRLGIKLSHCQVAGFGGALGTDADELPDRGQRAAQDGDREDHLEKR